MTALLDHLQTAPTLDRVSLAFTAERAWLEDLARDGDGAELRAQAMVELMGLEVACDDELAFERLRHELGALTLPPVIATLFRARAAVGLLHFGRTTAARRWAARATPAVSGAEVRDWLLELDRLLDPPVP